jgi:hypothetical protein
MAVMAKGKRRGPGGRPARGTPQMLARIIELARKGIPQTLIAKMVNLNPATIMRWKVEKREFGEAFRAAELASVEELVGHIVSQARTDWKAAAWILQRKYPADFNLESIMSIKVDRAEAEKQKDMDKRWRETLAIGNPTTERN